MLRSLSLIRGAIRSSVLIKPSGSFHSVALQSFRSFSPGIFPASKSIHGQGTAQRQNDVNVDRSLSHIDQEIKRTGRINRKEIEEILGDIREIKEATSSQSLMILRCCGELVPGESPENRTKLVQEVWKTMESLNVPVDISHYNALLKVYLENEHNFIPAEFLQELSDRGIEPNRVTYQRLIAHFCQKGNIDGATTILQHMKEKELPINEHVFNALVLGHAQANDMESAEGMLSVMSQAGLEPNDDTYIILMTGYAKIGDIGNVHRIVKECEEKEIFLVDRDFLNVIYTLATSEKDHLIDEVVPYLRKHSGFNQDATNVILRLVNAGKTEVGYKILQLMPRGMRQDEYMPSGNFFIKQMILSSTPSTTIIKYCREMCDSGLNKNALSLACEIALTNKKLEKAVDLLAALKESGFPMRQHYFWPFFAGKRTENEVYDGLKCMMVLEVPPNTETLREYVVPALMDSNTNLESLHFKIEKLSGYTRIPVSMITPCVLHCILHTNDLNKAAKIVARHKISISGANIRRALVNSYLSTENAKGVALVIASSWVESEDNLRELVGEVLLEVIDCVGLSKKLRRLEPLLKELVDLGLGMSNSTAVVIQNSLGEGMTPNIANCIMKLTSKNTVVKVEPVRGVHRMNETEAAELEAIVEENQHVGAPNKGLQKTLLLHYCREKNLEKAEKLLSVMKEQGFTVGPNIQFPLLDLYSDSNQIDKAKEIYDGIKSSNLDLFVDDLKLLRYINLLAAHGHHEDVLKVIRENKKNDTPRIGYTQNHLAREIVNTYAEQGKSAEVKQILDLLVENGLAQANSFVLGPLVNSYLVRDDLEGAMTEFERCVKEYRASPYKMELFCRFIKTEDAERLQKVLDLSTSLYGEVNSLYDLVFAFLECGKIRQAKKILDTPGLRARNDKLDTTCQKYLEANRIEDLENLVEITKHVFNIDRNSLYHHLLKAYINKGDTEKALSILTSLQEENVQASDNLLVELANFLQTNNMQVPFVIPKGKDSVKKSDIKEFRAALDSSNINKAMLIKERLETQEQGEKLNWSHKGQLVHHLIRAERINEAVSLTEEMAVMGNFPKLSVLTSLKLQLTSQGDADTLARLLRQLPQNIAKRIQLRKAITMALLNAGKTQQCFTEQIKNVVESTENTHSSRHVLAFDVMKILEKQPEYLPEVEALSQKCVDRTIYGLNSGLWYYYMKQKDFTRARDILVNKVQPGERIMFEEVVDQAKNNVDLELARELWEQLQNHVNINPSDRGYAASCLVDVLRSKGELNAALETLQLTLKQVQLKDFPNRVLIDLKTDLESKNLNFPYEILKKDKKRRGGRRRDESSSDSDSDSD
ncbi:unnamed protein product [Allacma fusca]|uniref:Leucine-rich PPR motif-containing protein, mitochondrial n=1 Tax=Allacma fusca TaxID=39272 RepID=A0A8J2JVF6_9HEXA|nr:unnamed protein product [Allacma fusca]